MGTALFLVSREARAYADLKRDVAELKHKVSTVEDSFKRATAEHMSFVRQATKQLVDLSVAHHRLEEEVASDALVAAAGRTRGGDAARVGTGAGARGDGDGTLGARGAERAAVKAAGQGDVNGFPLARGEGAIAAEGVKVWQQQQQRGREVGVGGGGGNPRGGGGTSSEDGLWETSGSDVEAAGGLARNVKVGELPWDSEE